MVSGKMRRKESILDAFLRGYARNADFFGALRHHDKKLHIMSDEEAIRSDWKAVGGDMGSVMPQINNSRHGR